MFEVIHGDCIRVLEELRRGGLKFDAVIADPPYCSGGITPAACMKDERKYIESTRKGSKYYQKNGSFDDGMSSHAYFRFSREWLIEARACLRSPGYVFIFTDWRMLPVISDAAQSAGFYTRGLVTWEKGNSRPQRGHISQTTEFVLWGTSTSAKSQKYVTKNTIFEPAPPAEKRIHPTEKNPRVIRRLLEILDDDARAVLDPFCGSGAAGIAALDRGLDYVGVDMLEEYTEKTKRRLKEYEQRRKNDRNGNGNEPADDPI